MKSHLAVKGREFYNLKDLIRSAQCFVKTNAFSRAGELSGNVFLLGDHRAGKVSSYEHTLHV